MRNRADLRSEIDGFTHYRIDAVIKFGGSLTRDLRRAQALLSTLVASAQNARLLIVPGGGRTDKVIEAIDRERPLAPLTAHRACALAQDQTGLLLADPGLSRGLVACETITACLDALRHGYVPVLLPSRLIFDLDPVAMTWDVTSDAVAAWVAWLVRSPRLAILTDVDGIYPPDRIGDPACLVSTIDYEQLLAMGPTSIDRCAASFIARHEMDAVVLNGNFPDRLADWIDGRRPHGTVITRSTTDREGEART